MTASSKSKRQLAQANADQYDSPWKAAIEEYFAECVAFFFPKIHADIDWTKGYEFLDKELEKIVRQAVATEQHVDKLVKVFRLSGDETWVLLHIDVQSQHETDFAKRMFQYNYRLFDRYDRSIVSVIIYGDESKSWRPNRYQRALWDFEVQIKFPTVKLLDYKIEALEQSSNPFSFVVLAHRYTKATKNKPDERFAFKWRLTRMLYERGYTKKQILSLYRYIDWLMALPLELELKLGETVAEYEEANKVAYMSYFERVGFEQGIERGIEQGIERGIEQGIEQGVLTNSRDVLLDILMIRFGNLPDTLIEMVNELTELDLLKKLYQKAVVVESFPLFEQFTADELRNSN